MNRRLAFALVVTVGIGSASAAMAFPRNDSWHTAAWGHADLVRGEAGGIYGTGGQTDYGIRCSSCHTDERLGLCTDPMVGTVDLDMTVSPAFGTTADGETSYRAGQRYQITMALRGEHRGSSGHNQNGMAATIEDASGRVAGRFVTDSGADSAACTPGLPSGVGSHDGRGTTFVYGDCHAVLSVADMGGGRSSWTFDWIAPASGGDLTLFVGAVDGDTAGEGSLCDDVVERAIPLIEE